MTVRFSWDPGKEATNRRKHGITFNEALTVFADPLARIFDDPDHSRAEARELIVGHSAGRRCCSSSSPSGMGTASVSLALARQPLQKGATMKKAAKSATSDMRREYKFDYSKAKPNRFANRACGDVHAVVLDRDVSEVFRSSADVNRVLRAVIRAMPKELRAAPR